METVFDHAITPEECKYIGAYQEKEEYLKWRGESTANFDLALLYHLRGNKKMWEHYANKLSPEDSEGFYRTISHP